MKTAKHAIRLIEGAAFIGVCGLAAWVLIESGYLWALGAAYGAAAIYAVGCGIELMREDFRR